ncbi:MAG: DUF3047 domain-containing protein [Pseudomonadota bacterium]
MGRLLLGVLTAAALAGCAAAPRQIAPDAAAVETEAAFVLPLFNAADALTEDWRYVKIWGETEFNLVPDGEGVAIEAIGRGSSGGLTRYLEIDTEICPIAEWSWRVDQMPPEADLTVKAREDMAAAVFFVFGDPGVFSSPRPVPTIRYAWTTEANPENQVVDSPYLPGVLRTVVARSGDAALGTWVTERRSLRDDYERVFGEAPDGPVEVLALFSDNDHTEAPAVARFGWARMRCTEEPEGPSIF